MEEERKPLENRNFIDAFIEEDLAPGGRFEGKRVHTRFPPEQMCIRDRSASRASPGPLTTQPMTATVMGFSQAASACST